jgi:hypothetical protein
VATDARKGAEGMIMTDNELVMRIKAIAHDGVVKGSVNTIREKFKIDMYRALRCVELAGVKLAKETQQERMLRKKKEQIENAHREFEKNVRTFKWSGKIEADYCKPSRFLLGKKSAKRPGIKVPLPTWVEKKLTGGRHG